jgi:hypothetical protein
MKNHANCRGFAYVSAAVIALALLTSCSTAVTAPKPTACSIRQASILLFDNLGTTVRSADPFAVPEVLKISATQVCSGVFLNGVQDPSLSAHSVAVFDGGKAVFAELTTVLKEAGFSGPEESGQGTEGWKKGDLQVYAIPIYGYPTKEYANDFPRSKILVKVLVQQRKQ